MNIPARSTGCLADLLGWLCLPASHPQTHFYQWLSSASFYHDAIVLSTHSLLLCQIFSTFSNYCTFYRSKFKQLNTHAHCSLDDKFVLKWNWSCPNNLYKRTEYHSTPSAETFSEWKPFLSGIRIRDKFLSADESIVANRFLFISFKWLSESTCYERFCWSSHFGRSPSVIDGWFNSCCKRKQEREKTAPFCNKNLRLEVVVTFLSGKDFSDAMQFPFCCSVVPFKESNAAQHRFETLAYAVFLCFAAFLWAVFLYISIGTG